MSDNDSEDSWDRFLAECADDAPELRADEPLIDYDLDGCIEQIDGQESMQDPSEEDGSCPRASDPQGSGQDPGGTHQGGKNAPITDVGDPRGSQDIVMTDAATLSGAVINPEGARAEREPLAPIPPERAPIPPMQEGRLTSEQARQRSMQQVMTMQRAQAPQTIWRGAPKGAENMARRTAIVVSPRLDSTPPRWQQTPTERQTGVRKPAVLEQDNLHIKMLAGEILTIKPKETKQIEAVEQIQEQLEVAKAQVQRLEEQTDIWRS